MDWEKEIKEEKLCTLNTFLGRSPTHEEAKEIVKLASILGIPSFKKEFPHSKFSVNIYPKYWLKEYFGQD